MSRSLSRGLIVLLLAGLACGGEETVEETLKPVTLVRVESVDLVERIEATGELRAVEHAEVAAEVAGRVTELLADEGARVEAGTAVVAIDPERRALERDSAQARVAEAAAQERDAKRDFQRIRDLHARKVASDTQLDQAETAYKRASSQRVAAEAELGMQQRALRDARVTAPFAGFIARRTVNRGEYVQPGDPLFELVALDPIEVEFQVPEVDSGRVAIGQTVDVELAPFPEEIFVASVIFVSPMIDKNNRTLRVKAQLPNPEGRFRPGLFARIDLGISERKGVAMIPEEAVLQRAEGQVVFRALPDDRVERLVIETGTHRDGLVAVTRGLAAGDKIVLRGAAWIADGERVAPRDLDGTLVPRPLPEVAEGAPEGDAAPASKIP